MPQTLSDRHISNMYFNVPPTTITVQEMNYSSPISRIGDCIAVISLPIKVVKNIFQKISVLVA